MKARLPKQLTASGVTTATLLVLTSDHREREGGLMAIPIPLQNLLHESHMISISHGDLPVTEVMLKAVVEEV